ncbi:hypothetical protein KSP39_PZI022633 [Platanthera zijinensis]|uniref:Uncharacterized protein n=1 Tax=Platanthera zijinensis TaxID=2320716 RepID=A0AAP0AW30_9ASPA
MHSTHALPTHAPTAHPQRVRASAAATAASRRRPPPATTVAGQTYLAPSLQYYYYAMSTIAVRFMIDRAKKRVVFAEAGSDFVDVLFSFLTLPLATIVRLLEKQSGLGSLDTLYESVERLDAKHLQTEACKEMLLNPRNAAEMQCEYLKIKGIHDPNPRTVFICSETDCLTQPTSYYTYNSKCLCSRCGKLMGKTLQWPEETSGEGGIFVNDKVNFMITDGLRVIPSSLLKGLTLFKGMQIKDASMLEERVIDLGKEEILMLLRRSLVSNKVLTYVCFPDAPVQASSGVSLPIKEEITVKEAEKEINLKLVLNKENNNVLYAEVGVDFINLLFSFFTFPLGALPTFYGCNKNQILHWEEITSKKFIVPKGCLKCYLDNGDKSCGSAPCEHGIEQAEVIEWSPKSSKIMADVGEAFVVGSQKYMISDNLHVSPLSIISAVGGEMDLPMSIMVGKEIFLDNVKARSLLGAMLISKTVLTDVFSCSVDFSQSQSSQRLQPQSSSCGRIQLKIRKKRPLVGSSWLGRSPAKKAAPATGLHGLNDHA